MKKMPDYCEPILAWRSWRVRGGNSLTSRGYVRWLPYRKLEAQHIDAGLAVRGSDSMVCKGSPCDGHVPYMVPKCGVYGFKSLDELRKQSSGALFWATHGPTIVGAVHLWGRIIEHEHGYRAQFAYPARFIYGHDCDAAAIAALYGVPFQEDDTWKSVYQYDDSWLSPFKSQSLFSSRMYFSQILPRRLGVITAIDPATGPSWTSQYLYPPNNWSPIKKPKPPKIHQQPSFRIYRPTEWYHDKGRKLWLRTDVSA
jgi:hypothetical protein